MDTIEIQLSRGRGVTKIDADCLDLVKPYAWRLHTASCKPYVCGRLRSQGWQGPRVYLHRLIMDAGAEHEVDHINGDGLDNRRCNLRLCTTLENHYNETRKRTYKGKPASSVYRGVTWYAPTKSWVVKARIPGTKRHIGYFKTEIEAALAYNHAVAAVHGSFFHPNIIIDSDPSCGER